jgi:epoxide hydrolase 4
MHAPIRIEMIEANGLVFETDTCGDGPKFALLLHGFPETKHSWRNQLPLLAELGYTAWAPNLRGYGQSSRPEGIANYHIDKLTQDVAGLIDAKGANETLLIAHDWGGLIAWTFAMKNMRPLSNLIQLNIPHPACLNREWTNTWDQKKRSWYALFFQIPGLPEWALTRNNAIAVRKAFTDMAIDKSRFPDAVTDVFVQNALRPGGMTAMLNYYRAAFRAGAKALSPGSGLVQARTLMIWGENDSALGKPSSYGTHAFVPDVTIRYLPGVSHWVQQEAPEVVNAMIRAFLANVPVPEASALR